MDLTREQILNMTSQELAEATAVHVMGWVKQRTDNEWDAPIYGWFDKDELKVLEDEWNPAEGTRDAWRLIEQFPAAMIARVEVFKGHVTNEVTLYPSTDDDKSYTGKSHIFEVAACHSALLAVKGL